MPKLQRRWYRVPWTPEMDALLGTAPDREVARSLGIGPVVVAKRRLLLGKPRPGIAVEQERQRRVAAASDEELMTHTTHYLAHSMGVPARFVSAERARRQIKARGRIGGAYRSSIGETLLPRVLAVAGAAAGHGGLSRVAELLGVSRERARQLAKSGLDAARASLEADES